MINLTRILREDGLTPLKLIFVEIDNKYTVLNYLILK